MPQAKHNLASLTFEIAPGADGVVPSEAHLLPTGPFRADDGRPFECQAWLLDATIAKKLIALAAGKKTDMLIDYEHQSLRSASNGQPAPAAGWCPNTLEWRDAKGLYAVGIGWTESAKRQIAAKEYRYVSCVFAYDPKTGEVMEIVSFALTNTPALDGLDALADMARTMLSRGFDSPTKGANQMDKDQQIAALNGAIKTQVAALTTERDGLKTQVAALTGERDTLKASVAAAEQEKAQAALAAEKAKHADLLQAALTDGRLTPAQKPWAEKQGLTALTEYLDASKPLALLGKQADGKGADGNHGLNADELAACSRAGLTPEEFIKSKKQ